jgi:hypothetical protein
MPSANKDFSIIVSPAFRSNNTRLFLKEELLSGEHADAAVTSLIPALSCRSCRPNAPFAELVRLSPASIADEMREDHR